MKLAMSVTIGMVAFTVCDEATAAEPLRGHHTDVAVSAETRLDWMFALANQSPKAIPAGWLDDYESVKRSYEIFVPPGYDPKRTYPLILFISPSARATGYRNWRPVSIKHDVIFVSPHRAGNNCPQRQRVRIVMDVLDDVRRKFNTDVDRTYIGGFSGGGRIACAIAFALPEYFGGVIPVCASGDLQQESWLRHRVIDRLSVAHVTGEKDFNRSKVSRFRGPLLADVGVRSRVWVVPGMDHGIPGGEQLQEVYRWLDAGTQQRQKLGRRFPACRIPANVVRSRDEWSGDLLAEAKLRLGAKKTVFSGLMQLMGIRTRWPDLPAANEAKQILQAYEKQADRSWEQDDIDEQQKFLIARVRALDAYATGDLPKQYADMRAALAGAALNLWKIVIADTKDGKTAKQAQGRIDVLQAIIDKQKNR